MSLETDLREPLLLDDQEQLSEPLLNDASSSDTVAESPPVVRDDDDDDDDHANPWQNRNVLLSLWLCVVSGTADSIWGSVVLSGFLLALAAAMGETKEQNTLVGGAEAAQGLTQLLTALPIGVLADKLGKARIVRWGGLLMLATVALTLWALVIVRQDAKESQAAAVTAYYVMVGALCLWGVVGGISYGPCQALYADSIPTGQRSELLTWLYACYLLSSAVGPIVSIILFLTLGKEADDWSIEEIFPVFAIGVLLEIPAAIIMFFFSEKYVVHEEEPTSPIPTTTATAVSDSEEEGEAAADETQPAAEAQRHLTKAAIPYVLFASSLIVSLGSGASVKYFPLFFKELGLSSSEVQGIFLIVPLSISGFSFVAQKTSQWLGRVETTVFFDIVGVSLLYGMTWLSRKVDPHAATTLWQTNPYLVLVIVGVYWLRTGIINSSYPLLESILMDNVPSNQRARWKSLESIASFGWTGSALIGGILSDKHSYQFTFGITASMQLAGGLLLLLIRPLVEAEQPRSSEAASACRREEAEEATCAPTTETAETPEIEY